MALADPFPVTISAVLKNLVRIKFDGYTSEYYLRETLVEYWIKVRHSDAKDTIGTPQDRHNVELLMRTYATAALPAYEEKVYFVTQANPGRSAIALALALFVWANSTNLGKLDGKES